MNSKNEVRNDEDDDLDRRSVMEQNDKNYSLKSFVSSTAFLYIVM